MPLFMSTLTYCSGQVNRQCEAWAYAIAWTTRDVHLLPAPEQAVPLVRADHQGGAHGEPVWALRWLDRGPDSEELLLSASTDGRISQWSLGQVWDRMYVAVTCHASVTLSRQSTVPCPRSHLLCMQSGLSKQTSPLAGACKHTRLGPRTDSAVHAQGLEHTDLMVLKVPPAPKSEATAASSPSEAHPVAKAAAPALSESFLGRRSGGLCLALLGGREGREYLVGAAMTPFCVGRACVYDPLCLHSANLFCLQAVILEKPCLVQ